MPLRVIVPITDWKPRYGAAPWMVKLEPDATNNLAKTSSADCFQIRSVSHIRFVKKIGEVHFQKMEDIAEALAVVLKI